MPLVNFYYELNFLMKSIDMKEQHKELHKERHKMQILRSLLLRRITYHCRYNAIAKYFLQGKKAVIFITCITKISMN